MAYTVFNIIGGTTAPGSNLNSGSTTAAAAAYTSTSGNWSTVTNQFTPTDGSTPASSISVGDYVAIYTNGATSTSYVAQVTAVAAGANGAITVSASVDYGTPPATASGTISLKAGGAWADFTPVANFGTATVPQSTEIDVKGQDSGGAITYTLGAALTLALKGTTTTPLWYRGYNTTVGDLDAVSVSLSYPTIATGTNLVTVSGGWARLAGLSFTSTRAGALGTTSGAGGPVFFDNCLFSNTAASASAATMNAGVAGGVFTDCWFGTSASANQIMNIQATTEIHGCWFNGANSGATQVGVVAPVTCVITDCTFFQIPLDGIQTTGIAGITVRNCTFSQCSRDGIRLTAVPAANSIHSFTSNLFRKIGGSAINNTTGTNTANVLIKRNAYYSITGSQTSGFGDDTEIQPITELSDPCVSDTDLHLVSTALSAGAGFPGQWPNESGSVAYPDIGAWQRQVTAATTSVESLILQPPSTY